MSSNTEASTEAVSESLAEKKYEILKRKCDSLEEVFYFFNVCRLYFYAD